MKFKVGDKVRVVTHRPIFDDFPIGHEFEITRIWKTHPTKTLIFTGLNKLGKQDNIYADYCTLAIEANIDELFYSGAI